MEPKNSKVAAPPRSNSGHLFPNRILQRERSRLGSPFIFHSELLVAHLILKHLCPPHSLGNSQLHAWVHSPRRGIPGAEAWSLHWHASLQTRPTPHVLCVDT
eukprot:Trichotokara_eunicae@DN3937_c0_g1_i2.p3